MYISGESIDTETGDNLFTTERNLSHQPLGSATQGEIFIIADLRGSFLVYLLQNGTLATTSSVQPSKVKFSK